MMLDRASIKELMLITLNNLKSQHMVYSPFHPIILADTLNSLAAIRKLLAVFADSSVEDDDLIIHINILLSERWSRIKCTPLCYSVNTENLITQFYRQLCTLAFGEEKNSLLMSTVMVEDHLGVELNSLTFGSFILSDNAEEFIDIQSWIDHTVTSMLSDGTLFFKTISKLGQTRELSLLEKRKLKPYCNQLRQIFSALPKSSLLEELQKLYKALQQGDVNHDGRELEAGGCAYVGMANFFKYFNGLKKETQSIIRCFHNRDTTLGNLLDRLNRSHIDDRGRGISSCIKLISIDLNLIIQNNTDAIRNLSRANLPQLTGTRENVIGIVTQINKNLGKLHPLSPSSSSYSNRLLYSHYGKIALPAELNTASHLPHFRTFAILNLFICNELDRMLAADVLKIAKINQYLTVLFSIGKESFEFMERSQQVQSEILKELFFRITVLSDYKPNKTAKHLLFKSTCKKQLATLIENNQDFFNALGLPSAVPTHKRQQIEGMLCNAQHRQDLGLIASEEIARCYTTPSQRV